MCGAGWNGIHQLHVCERLMQHGRCGREGCHGDVIVSLKLT